MTKIYEALQRAGHERSGKKKEEVASVISFPPPGVPPETINSKLEPALTTLYRNILVSLPGKKRRIIQFIEPEQDAGASKIVREFAKMLACKMNQPTLLVDANRRRPGQSDYFGVKLAYRAEKAESGSKSIMTPIRQIGQSRLFFSQLSLNGHGEFLIYNLPEMEIFFMELESFFEMILIDSSAASSHQDVIVLSPEVDGVIIVVESEKTRRQVLEKIKDRILEDGGAPLGVILNKQRYPIPEFIYKRL